MKVIKSPNKYRSTHDKFVLFLAGSIEMNKAEKWQESAEKYFKDEEDIILLNPRRDDWNSSWDQSKDCPEFVEQVEWELTALETVDAIILYFDPKTKSPISLLELGKFGNKCLVCCPDGYWRKGNVEVFCSRYNIPMYKTLEDVCKAAVSKSKVM